MNYASLLQQGTSLLGGLFSLNRAGKQLRRNIAVVEQNNKYIEEANKLNVKETARQNGELRRMYNSQIADLARARYHIKRDVSAGTGAVNQWVAAADSEGATAQTLLLDVQMQESEALTQLESSAHTVVANYESQLQSLINSGVSQYTPIQTTFDQPDTSGIKANILSNTLGIGLDIYNGIPALGLKGKRTAQGTVPTVTRAHAIPSNILGIKASQ